MNDETTCVYVGKINNIYYFANTSAQRIAVYPPTPHDDAIVDSGASAHTLRDDAPVDDKMHEHLQKLVGTPNGATMLSNAHALLKHNLPQPAREANTYPELTYRSLISVGQLCDAGYRVVFDQDKVEAISRNNTIDMVGTRDTTTGLYLTPMNPNTPASPLTNTPTATINNVYTMSTKVDLAKYHHQSVWSPVPRTWTNAITKGFFATFPGPTPQLITKHLPKSPATTKGHQKMIRQHTRSTKDATFEPTEMTALPSARTNNVVLKTIDLDESTGKVATDQTGRFPIKSSRGNQYLMVAYIHDANAIMAVPIKNRSEQSLVDGYKEIYEKLTTSGLQPRLHISDNECSAAFKRFLAVHDIKLQLVPPYDHRTNPAERAIGTFKAHFIAGLASLPPQFPMHLWDRLIEHATITLNLLRASRLHPTISAYHHVYGAFDYNRTPLAPPGCKVVIYDAPSNRRTWDSKGTDAWYLGPATEHYRCHRCYVPTSRSERVAKTVEFFPHQCAVPYASAREDATHAAKSLADALNGYQSNCPYEAPGDAQMKAIKELSDIFTQLTTRPTQLKDVATQPRVPIAHPPPQPQQNASLPRVAMPPSTPHQLTPHAPPPRVGPPHGPHVIPPDDDEKPRYNLRSRANNINAVPINPHAYQPPMTFTNAAMPKCTLPHHHAHAVVNEITGVPEEYPALARGPDKKLWHTAYANDLDRLAQGKLGRVSATNTIFFINHNQVPNGRKVTYGKKECTIRPTKAEIHRVRLTVGGDRLDYPGDPSSQCASLITTKLLINSTISTKGARFGTADIKNFYYGTPLARYEYMKIRFDQIPQEIVDAYNLKPLEHNGYIFMEIRKGMPGLKQAGRIANDRLVKHLAPYGYVPVRHTPSLWRHTHRPITFTLVVDDFGIKYEGREHFDHLIAALRDLYTVTVDEHGKKYLGLTMDWHHDQGYVDISMPGYVERALHRFQHPHPKRKQHSPHAWQPPKFGQKVQFCDDDDDSPHLPMSATKRAQQIVGTFLYYALALDFTMLVTLGSISQQTNAPTEYTMSEIVWFLDYCATHPDATIRYTASDMHLWTSSDASYLSEPNSKSRAGGFYFLGDKPQYQSKDALTTETAPLNTPTPNGPVHVLAKIMSNIMSSAMEAEVGAAFLVARDACPIRVTLEELGHPQTPTPLKVDNTTAVGFANGRIRHKRSKAIDMRFHWICDRVNQDQFAVYWTPGDNNEKADYVTKHHPVSHHKDLRHKLFNTQHLANVVVSQLLQGCVNTRKTRNPIQSGNPSFQSRGYNRQTAVTNRFTPVLQTS